MDLDDEFFIRYADECAKADIEPLSPQVAMALAIAVVNALGLLDPAKRQIATPQ